MTLKELVIHNRSYRRFKQTPRPEPAILQSLIATARLTASGGNLQPIRYRLVSNPTECNAVFPLTRWAGLLRDWNPTPAESPTAYIMILADKKITQPHTDAGIAMQTILLAAAELGWGGCMLGSIDRPRLRTLLNIPDTLEILYAIALGKPAEVAVLEDARDQDIAYYRTDDDIHRVPKLPLSQLIIN